MLLTEVDVGDKVKVLSLKANGIQRRRLLDLGLVPDTEVLVKRRSPLGDPTAFFFRGTLIALRSEETDLIEVKRGG